METVCSVACSKQLTTEHYPEPDESTPQLRLLFYYYQVRSVNLFASMADNSKN